MISNTNKKRELDKTFTLTHARTKPYSLVSSLDVWMSLRQEYSTVMIMWIELAIGGTWLHRRSEPITVRSFGPKSKMYVMIKWKKRKARKPNLTKRLVLFNELEAGLAHGGYLPNSALSLSVQTQKAVLPARCSVRRAATTASKKMLN